MARKTQAEKLAEQRQAREQALRQEEEAHRASYPNELLDAVARASLLGLTLAVDSEHNFVVFPNDSDYPNYHMAMTYNQASYNDLQAMTAYLDDLQWEMNEAQRKSTLRASALAKLTKEEREALGV